MKKLGLIILIVFTIVFSGCTETCTKRGYSSDSIYQKCHGIGENKELCEETQYCAWCNAEYQSCDANFENCENKQGKCTSISDICAEQTEH